MMKRVDRRAVIAGAGLVLLVGCAGRLPAGSLGESRQSGVPVAGGQPDGRTEVAQGTLLVAVRWPDRSIQTIPLGTAKIRIRVLKGAAIRQELPLGRPADNGGPLVSKASLQLDAESGLTVLAEAFRLGTNPASGDISLASASVSGVEIVPNQRTTATLELIPAFVPVLTGFTPDNGGPGVRVTLTGAFGSSGYYGVRIGTTSGWGSASGSTITAEVPQGATTGPVSALDDGVPSAPGATFSVLASLALQPQTVTLGKGQTATFSVPTGTDTLGRQVANPTLTRWEVFDPTPLFMPGAGSAVGTLTPAGLFLAQATGTAWVQVWSGNLAATAAVTVN